MARKAVEANAAREIRIRQVASFMDVSLRVLRVLFSASNLAVIEPIH